MWPLRLFRRRRSPRALWWVVGGDLLQYGGVALLAVLLALGIHLLTIALTAARGRS